MEKMLESGARLVVSDARFQDADALFKALAKNVRHMTLTPDLLKMDVAVLQGPIIDAATSDEVSDKLFKCLALCTYEGQRVSRELFDDPKLGRQARADYFQIAWEVIRFNCGPFLERIPMWLKALRPTKESVPAPASPPTPS